MYHDNNFLYKMHETQKFISVIMYGESPMFGHSTFAFRHISTCPDMNVGKKLQEN